VYFEKDREQSLIDNPALANSYLREAYELLARYKIGGNSMPLIAQTAKNYATHDPIGINADLYAVNSPQRDGCIFIRRTGTVLVDGEVPSCGAPFVKMAGVISQTSNFMSIWNGTMMKEVRAVFNTSAEWEQCQHCWYREGAYQRQRQDIATGHRPEMTEPSIFTEGTWDFRKNDKTPCSAVGQRVEYPDSGRAI
jgi:hypothetical protein